jgi:hypothetical protein
MQRATQRSQARTGCERGRYVQCCLKARDGQLAAPAHVEASGEPPQDYRPGKACVSTEPNKQSPENLSCFNNLPCGQQLLAMLAFGEIPFMSDLLV